MIMIGQEARLAEPLSRRHKRLMLVAVVAVVAVIAGIAVYGTRQASSYGRSANGCVTLKFAGVMGSAAVHRCGQAAREWCAFEDGRSNLEARLVGVECRQAGYPRVSAVPPPART